MFKSIASQFLQHITHQNNWSRKYLIPFSGKIIQFNITPIKTKLEILDDGSLGIPAENAVADATVYIPPSLALRLLAKDEAAKMLIEIDGDSHFATEIAKILQNMRWDIEEDLSKAVGDIPANKISKVTKNSLTAVRSQSINAAEMLKEYWQEEKPLLAKKWQIEKFNSNVDQLRSDVTRLEKKLDKLKRSLQERTTI